MYLEKGAGRKGKLHLCGHCINIIVASHWVLHAAVYGYGVHASMTVSVIR